jgi:acyl-CoA reductase-like NAD-dependent aldehyde dehydrogenase
VTPFPDGKLDEDRPAKLADRQIASGSHGVSVTGTPTSQIKKGAIPRTAQNFRFFADMASEVGGGSFSPQGAFRNYAIRRPVGVAGLITPWNTPFMLETWNLVPCLAAGDTCILKPAEWSPCRRTCLPVSSSRRTFRRGPSMSFTASAKRPARPLSPTLEFS